MKRLARLFVFCCGLAYGQTGTKFTSEQIQVRGIDPGIYGGTNASLYAALVAAYSHTAYIDAGSKALVNARDAAVIQLSSVLPPAINQAVSDYTILGDGNLVPNSVPMSAFPTGAVPAYTYVAVGALTDTNLIAKTLSVGKLKEPCVDSRAVNTNDYESAQFMPQSISGDKIASGAVSARVLSSALQNVSGPGTPPGSVRPFATAGTAPGWVKCDGRLVPVALFFEPGDGTVFTNPYAHVAAVCGVSYTTNSLGHPAYVNTIPSQLGLGPLFDDWDEITACVRIPDARGMFASVKPPDLAGATMHQPYSVLPKHQHAIFKRSTVACIVSGNYEYNLKFLEDLSVPSGSYYAGPSLSAAIGPLLPSVGLNPPVSLTAPYWWGLTRNTGIYMQKTASGSPNVASTETAPQNIVMIYRIYLGRKAVEYGISD